MNFRIGGSDVGPNAIVSPVLLPNTQAAMKHRPLRPGVANVDARPSP